MNHCLHAIKVLMKRRIVETLVTPGFYITAGSGLLLGHLMISGFCSSIDSSGLNFELNPVYSLIQNTLSGIFGDSFVEKLFSQGPFEFAFLAALFPIFLYLSLSSVYKIGFEKSVGAFELLMYGPVNGISYFLSFLLKDLLLIASYSLLIILFSLLSELLNNLAFGGNLFHSAVMIFFFTLGIYSYGILSSAITDNAASSTALFLGFILLFSLVQIGSFSIAGEYVMKLSTTIAWIIQWFSPVFYWTMGLQAAEYGNVVMQALSICSLIILSGILLFLSHVAVSVRGVRV